MPQKKATRLAGGSNSGTAPREEHPKEIQRLKGIQRFGEELRGILKSYSCAAVQLGLSHHLDFDCKCLMAFVDAAVACNDAQHLHGHVQQRRQLLTKCIDQLLHHFMELNPGRSLAADAVLKHSFLTHCMLTFELDSLAHHSLLNDPQLSANDVAVRLALLAYIYELTREMQLKVQKLLPPGKFIPEVCLLEPSHSEAKRANIMWDPVLLTIWFKSMSDCRNGTMSSPSIGSIEGGKDTRIS